MLFGFISGNFTLFNFFLSTDHVFFRIFAENYLITVILHMNRTTTFVSSFLFVVLASLFAGTLVVKGKECEVIKSIEVKESEREKSECKNLIPNCAICYYPNPNTYEPGTLRCKKCKEGYSVSDGQCVYVFLCVCMSVCFCGSSQQICIP